MTDFQLGTVLIEGEDTVVVGIGADIHRLDQLLQSEVPSLDAMLPDWQVWCDRIASALMAPDRRGKVARDAITWLPPIRRPPKLICLGTNYRAHATEVSAAP